MAPALYLYSIDQLVDQCQADLTEVNLSGCGKLTDAALTHLAKCDRFDSLILGKDSNDGSPAFTGSGLRLFLSLAALTTLKLSSYSSEEIFDALSSSSTVLHLTLEECELTDAKLTKVAKCSQLLSLDITTEISSTGITDAGIVALVAGCNGLVELNLSSCMRVTNGGLVHISTGLRDLKKLHLSKYWLDVYEDGVGFSGFTKVNDLGILRVCQGCKHLSDLDLSACYALSDAGLAAVSSLTGLTTLTISVREEGAKGHRCPDDAFTNITSVGLNEVVSSCLLLMTLDVCGLEKVVDDATLIAIGTHPKRLQHLCLGRLGNGVTGNVGFGEIARNCTLLKTLDFRFQRPFSDELFQQRVVSLSAGVWCFRGSRILPHLMTIEDMMMSGPSPSNIGRASKKIP